MANFLNINGWRVRVNKCELIPFEIGSRDRAVDGTPIIQRRAVKRRWRVDTPLLSWADANALWQLVQGRGHQWSFDGSTNPQDTSGAADIASKGGLVTTNSPTYALESNTAADGSDVNWMYSTSASLPVAPYGTHMLCVSPGVTNLFEENVRTGTDTASDITGFTADNGATITSNTADGHYWQGTRSLKVATPGVLNNEGFHTSNFTTSIGATYVCSFYVKVASGTPSLQVNPTTSGGVVETGGFNFTIPAAGEWHRVFVKFTATTTSSALYVNTHTAPTAVTFYCDGFQAEAYTGAISNVANAWVNGTRAQCANGTLTYSPTTLTTYNSHTLSAWVRSYGRPTGTGVGFDYIVAFGQVAGGSSNFSILFFEDGFPKFRVGNAAGSTITSAGAARLTPTSSWYHLAGVFDAVNLTTSIYVNGVLADSDTYNITLPDYSSTGSFGIGGANVVNYEMFSGLDEVTVLPFAAPAELVTAMATSSNLPWAALPKLKISGDAIDGTVTVIGNTQNGSFVPVNRSGTYSKNNFALSFELEEV